MVQAGLELVTILSFLSAGIAGMLGVHVGSSFDLSSITKPHPSPTQDF